MGKPIVAIVGRPNVGKSTLFNKLVGQRLAIVEDTPGVTRDRLYGNCEWQDHRFLLIDTGGIEPKADDVLLRHMRGQAQLAIDTADAILFVTDIRSGVTAQDQDIAAMLMRSGKPVFLVVNKVDGVGEPPMELYDFYSLGIGEPYPVSSVHGHGTGDLLEAVCACLPENEDGEDEDERIGVAVIGRPNVGKSTLTNALVGEKIAIVTNKPQTTRSRICAILNRGESQFVFVDTPGLHRARTRLGDYMVKVVTSSLSDVDCALLLVEPIPHVGGPEQALIDRIREEEIPCILCVNKIDTVEPAELLPVIAAYNEVWDGFDAIIPISAHKGGGLDDLMHELQKYAQEGPQLFPDGETTDQPERQVMGELLREKLLLCLDKEIPHGTAVEITKFSERDSGVVDVDATIYCEKASHKGIIIGKQGAMLKKISSLARADMEKFMGTKVYLQTWVKVKENWRDNLNYVRSMGYRDE